MNRNSDTQHLADDEPGDGSPSDDPRSQGLYERLQPGGGRAKARSKGLKVLWSFRYELLAVFLSVLGVFLLVEQFKIRSWVLGAALHGLRDLRDTSVWTLDVLSGIEMSDIAGIALLAAAVFLIGYDVRSRFLRRHQSIDDEPRCDRCEKPMHRSHSTRMLRWLSVVFRVRIKRFRCHKCGKRLAVWRRPHESEW
ncbi:MAG: hypothetical protein ACYC6Y_02740 [Thermoguttaceae bacterium]